MQTLSITSLIKDSPSAVAILDKQLCFSGYSKVWLDEFCPGYESIRGKNYFDVLPETPSKLKAILEECLNKGKESLSNSEKFIYPNGKVQWLKWKINAWTNADEKIGGLIVLLEDVTERSRREELYEKAERVGKIGGWEVDMTTNDVFWTDITKDIHQVADDYQPNLETSINFYKKGKNREKITNLVTNAITEGTPWDTELIIISAKGNEIWVRAKGEVEFLNGKCVRLYGTFQDITEKKITELSFRKVSERLALATKGANVGIWEYDLLSKKLVWDDIMYSLFGIEKNVDEVTYEDWLQSVHPEDRTRSHKEVKMAIAGVKDFDTQFRIVLPNGKIRHIKAIGVRHENADGQTVKMVGTNYDITELKNTQQMLQKSEESFHGAFENSDTGMAIVNIDGSVEKVNQSLCVSLGYSEEELQSMNFKDVTHPDDYEGDVHLLNEVIGGKRSSYKLEKRYFHKDGSIVYGILTATAVKDAGGKLLHFISQITDISPQIKNEKKLTRLVDITTEQNDSLLNFAHIVSHNLRSHSSNLSMLTNFLMKENSDKERKNLLDMLRGASESLNDTILHLNEVVQVKVGSNEKMKNINLYDTIKNVEKNLSLIIQEKDAVCEINIPKNLMIRVIPAYLDSIVLNLFTNSLKYSSPKRRPLIEITAEKREDTISVSFKDNGLGIDLTRNRDKLFGMYKTFHRNKDAKGIGLFITKNQIEAMNGKIEVESTVDIGSTFKIYFGKPLT
ncbi:PAS domain-containing sensor histidine kinase [Zobellia uliginosa]|uniref:PAS domain-containing sensor histidine kinase n=1 Tax=Zobellia uliginosa TaxID=143224 RepID=UPI001C0685CE|nr:PAS domain-containing sensor histidine kinase [Zobellia uliginosa]MBU2948531.1 PAS domain S-box protein [Zobellia uliginosa]